MINNEETNVSIFNTKLNVNKQETNVDIDKLFDVLKALFADLDLLDESDQNQDIAKFAFIRAFPDKSYESNNVVTFHVTESSPFVAKSLIGGKDSTSHRPEFKKQEYDFVTGNVEDTYFISQQHCIELRCFSRSGETCLQLAKTIEQILIVHSSLIKKYVRNYRHIASNGLEYIGEYDQKRLFTKALYYSVYTNVAYKTNLEQLKNITLTF